jgi:hypothetical protein
MVSIVILSAVDHGFRAPGKTKDHNIGICCFSAKRAASKSKIKDGLLQ